MKKASLQKDKTYKHNSTLKESVYEEYGKEYEPEEDPFEVQ